MPLLLWLVTTVALITVALASNRGSQGTCTGSWATLCTAGTSAANSPAGITRTGALARASPRYARLPRR